MPQLTPSSEDTRIYEFCVLYPYPMHQKEENELMKAIDAIFAEAEAKEVMKDNWGRRGLAYRIKGYDEGNFMVVYYEMDPSRIREVDEALRILPGVLRHIIVLPPKGYEVVQYSEKYEEWLKDKDQEEERERAQKEKEIARKVAEKAKRQAKRVETTKKKDEAEEAPKKASKEELSEQLDKIISDDDLDL